MIALLNCAKPIDKSVVLWYNIVKIKRTNERNYYHG